MNVARTPDSSGVVIWNGSRHHPGGRQLFAEEWPTIAPTPRDNARWAHHLSDEQVEYILNAYHRGSRPTRIADRLQVPVGVVQCIVDAAREGRA